MTVESETGDLSNLSRIEIYRIVRDAWSNAAAFAAAKKSLQEQMIAQCGDGTLRDCECSLAEDMRTVVVYANYSSDDTLVSGFMLAKPIAEDDFDREYYIFRLEESEPLK